MLFHPEVRNYEQGDIIIQQGAKGDEVFTLISGNAHALVGETVVGEVKCDEIFGAIAATGSSAMFKSFCIDCKLLMYILSTVKLT